MIRCVNCFNEYDEKYNLCPYCGYYEELQEKPIYRLPHGIILNKRYIIGEMLGVGGFGITYKAWDNKLEKIVAVKEYYPASIVNRLPGTKEVILVDKKSIKLFKFGYSRLLDEARYVAKMKGKNNIVSVFAFFEENNTSYMVMEYVKGIQLKNIVLQKGKLELKEVIKIALKICDALKVCQDEKIIHRDIAPDNIMIDTDNDNSLVLIDFGNARFSGAQELIDIIVKEGFSPVEQYEKVNKQGAWTDIYALGATLYYALSGIRPDESRNRKIEDTVISLHDLDETIPENISNIIMRAMAIESHLRYQNIVDFKKDLLLTIENGDKKILSIEEIIKKKKKKRIITISIAVIGIVIGFIFFNRMYMIERTKQHLPDNTTITVWISGDDEGNKEIAFNNMIKEFISAYEKDNITVELIAIPKDEYKDKLNYAAQSGTLPEVFENIQFDDTYTSYTQNVEEIASNIKDDVYFSEIISKTAKEKEIMVVGFDMPVLYINKILLEEDIKTYDKVLKKLNISDISKYTNLKGFLNGEEKIYYGYSSDYNEIQEALPAQYNLIKVPGTLNCISTMGFSITECNKNETQVAKRFIETLYSDSAGDTLFIQINTYSLPVNKNDLEVYEQVYSEYEGFFDSINIYKLNGYQ